MRNHKPHCIWTIACNCACKASCLRCPICTPSWKLRIFKTKLILYFFFFFKYMYNRNIYWVTIYDTCDIYDTGSVCLTPGQSFLGHISWDDGLDVYYWLLQYCPATHSLSSLCNLAKCLPQLLSCHASCHKGEIVSTFFNHFLVSLAFTSL